MRIRLIVNPTAGRGGGKTTDRILDYLRGKGASVDLFLTRKRGDALLAATEARDERIDMVVAAGGDGTINEVINGLVGSSIPLGIIPIGTVNVFALETGIPPDPLKACDIILSLPPKKISLGKVNDHYFLLMAGIGFDAYVVHMLNLSLKRLSGRLSYILTALRSTLSYPWHALEIELDSGRMIEGYQVVAGNTRYYGGKISITPFADLGRDDLDVCVFKKKGFTNIVRYAWGVLKKGHLAYPDVEYHRVKSLRVASKDKTYIQADGDVVGHLPAYITVVKEAVSIILP